VSSGGGRLFNGPMFPGEAAPAAGGPIPPLWRGLAPWYHNESERWDARVVQMSGESRGKASGTGREEE
jgi:hypothetical protein